jgi:glycosyltransferase involved in cell wall biosynthesis
VFVSVWAGEGRFRLMARLLTIDTTRSLYGTGGPRSAWKARKVRAHVPLYYYSDQAVMPSSPEVSVTIIFLDEERFLAEAVESVLAQSYTNWELLLVDDGSTDRSTEIARGYALANPDRIHYLEHPGHVNRGMSASRNLGVRSARGGYIALLDADDVWLPDKLEKQVGVLGRQHEAGMVYDATRIWCTWNDDSTDPCRERLRRLGFPANAQIQPPALVLQFLRGEAETPGTCSVLIRRHVWDALGGCEEAFRGMFEDQVFFYKVCLHYPVYLSDGSSSLYRQHPRSCSHVAAAKGLYRSDHLPNASRRAFLDWLTAYLRERGIEDNDIRQAMDDAMRPYRSPNYEIAVTAMAAKRVARKILPTPLRRLLTLPMRAYKSYLRRRDRPPSP